MMREYLFVFLVGTCGIVMCFQCQADSHHLNKELAAYRENKTPLDIHVTFNLPRYFPGDTAYYRIHVAFPDGDDRASARQVFRVSLLQNNGEEVYRSRVLVINGRGFGQMPIASDLEPGGYAVVVLKDPAIDEDIFTTTLWIAGPLTLREAPAAGLSFYPEGGKLIAGVTTKVVVRGAPNSSGSIFSSSNDEVVKFQVDDSGFGLFFLTPQPGETYHASSSGNTTIRLPEIYPDGVGILVTVPGNGQPIRATVQIPNGSAYRSDEFLVALTENERVYYTASISFANVNFQNLSFPQTDLSPGIVRITVYDKDTAALSQRLIFIQPSKPTRADIALSGKRYGPRDSVQIRLKMSNESWTQEASIAVTVYHEELDLPIEGRHDSLTQGVRTTSEFFEKLASAWNDRRKAQSIDNFLITREWTARSLTSEKGSNSFLTIRGRLKKIDGSKLPDPTQLTLFFERSVLTYAIDVDASGKFDFPVLMDFFGEEEIYFLAEHDGQRIDEVEIIMEDELPVDMPQISFESTGQSDVAFQHAKDRNRIVQSYSYYSSHRSPERPPSLNALLEEEVFGADVAIDLSEYVRFRTMAETLREIVPMLQYRRQQSRDVVRLFLEDKKAFGDGPPLFIIDGIITDNVTYFLALSPEDVLSIKLIHSPRKLQAFGSIGKNGIVLVETKISNHAAIIPRSETTVRVAGFEKVSPAHFPLAVQHKERVPDLRMNLYWNPDVRIDSMGYATINFQASDIPGKYRIVAEGFIGDQPVSAEAAFEVGTPW